MSQNSNRLILVFNYKASREACVLAFHHLARGDQVQSETYQQRLGVELTALWQEEWFNQAFKASSDFLVIEFDGATSDEPPYTLLRDLFKHGLAAAVLEVFYSQVCEYRREHFLAGKLVDCSAFLAARGDMAAVLSGELTAHDDLDEVNRPVSKPVPLQKLIDEQEQQEKQARALVDGLVALSKTARETGTNPIELAKGALLVGSAIRVLIHALVFTVLCVLLFNGLWLWIGLGVVLCAVLPLKYMAGVRDDLSDESEVASC